MINSSCLINWKRRFDPKQQFKIQLGEIHLTWKRRDDPLSVRVTTRLAVPEMIIGNDNEFRVTIDYPLKVRLGTLFPVKLSITNHTQDLLDLMMIIEASDAFVYSGYKTCGFRVLPFSGQTFNYCLVSLSSGTQTLPRFQILKKQDYLRKSQGSKSPSQNNLSEETAINVSLISGKKPEELRVFVEPVLGR